ncbi:Malonyl-[acyl-carrier protein] O-methyltransferase [Calidithermus roseus]|uniref:Malonyl-[acyl-carrier protein] O-methyltransferase n=1 Tax=Calidithermus roseus TaxID=1644118 RepID=A0A399EN15_9DEIN|nr:Malonyl-[acyl-carrier protein] O-methyltransferase [Calidithermus roseus]
MVPHSEDEVRRIRKAYTEYAGNPEVAVKWDPRNPGNRAIVREREERIQELLRVHGFWPLEPLHILDVGCGTGGMLAQLESWGAKPENLAGIDLIPERVARAQELYPHLHFICGNAEEMDFPQATFDLVAAFTVFSSILDGQMAQAVARRIWWVMRPGGAVLWYDFRYDNPNNPNVRGVKLLKIRHLFPGALPHLELVTLLPPLARRLGSLTPVLYPLLARIPLLCTHYLGLLLKPRVQE